MFAPTLLQTCKRVRAIASIHVLEGTSVSKLVAKSPQNGSLRFCGRLPLSVRHMSSNVRSPRTAHPQYHVFGEKNMMCFKIMLPGFRALKGDGIVTDKSKKGRMLLEFTPSNAEGRYQWNDQVRFGLSAEEVGLFCNQLPHHPIELSRSAMSSPPGEGDEDHKIEPITNDRPDKVLKISPSDGASVTFCLDYVKDGIGGQSDSGPLEVVAQAGEFEVISAIMRSSLPVLVGWSPLVDIALKSSINEAMNAAYGRGSGSGSGQQPWSGGGIRGDGSAGGNPPF